MSVLHLIIVLLIPVLLIAVVILVLLFARRKQQNHMTNYYSVKDPKGVEILEPILIGGVEQWLHIRGSSRENPVLLFVHGGPGLSQIGWLDAMQKPWEDYFTVVQWDQRQAGKSFSPMKKIGHTMTNRRMIDDTEEVIEHLRCRFQKEKIFIMGFSYGTYLSMHMVKRRPEYLHAYISLGQSVNVVRSIELEYELLLNHAKESSNHDLVTRLKALSPRIDPENKAGSFLMHAGFISEELGKIGKGIRRHMSQQQVLDMISYEQRVSPHLTLRDLLNPIFFGGSALGNPEYGFSDEFMNIDLPSEIGSEFKVPIFLFAGAHDWHIPINQQLEWFESITAPHKELVLFEESAHMPIHKEPGKFVVALVTKVLPFYKEQGRRGT